MALRLIGCAILTAIPTPAVKTEFLITPLQLRRSSYSCAILSGVPTPENTFIQGICGL